MQNIVRKIVRKRYKEAFPNYPADDVHDWVLKAVEDGIKHGLREAYFRSADGEQRQG